MMMVKGAKSPAREFPKGSGIKIRLTQNNSAGVDYGFSHLVDVPVKVTGTVRKRKRFSDKAKAETFAQNQWDGSKNQGREFFDLTDQQRKEAVAMLPKLEEVGLGLTEAVEYAIAQLRPAGGDKTVAEVAAEVVESKRVRYERGDLRERSYRDFKHRVNRFGSDFAKMLIFKISTDDVKEWLVGLGHTSPRTNRNDLAALSEVFRYAKQRRYLTENPIDFISDVDRRELCGGSGEAKEPAVLTLEQAEQLLTTARDCPDLGLLPAVVLGLFCGLRTEEIKRLDWKDVHLNDDSPVVTIGAAIAKKRRIRHVDIPSNALSWLSLCSRKRGAVAPNEHFNQFQKQFAKLLKAAGWGKTVNGRWQSGWERNAMRHSFGSYHYAMTGDPIETSRLLGHTSNDTVLFAHYRALASKAQGKAFFSLKPPSSSAKVVGFSA